MDHSIVQVAKNSYRSLILVLLLIFTITIIAVIMRLPNKDLPQSTSTPGEITETAAQTELKK